MMYLYLIILSLTEPGADRHPNKLSSNKSAIFPRARVVLLRHAFSLHRIVDTYAQNLTRPADPRSTHYLAFGAEHL